MKPSNFGYKWLGNQVVFLFMLNSTPRAPNFTRFKGQLEAYGGASGLLLWLIEFGQNGMEVSCRWLALGRTALHP
jgi:hypothetical protein